MNPRVFLIPARSFGEIAMTALRKVLGQAKSIPATASE